MKNHHLFGTLLTACAVSLSACASGARCPAGQSGKQASPEQQKWQETIRQKGADASLTIFPVVLWPTNETKAVGDIGKDIANVVGLMLEQAGMDNLETADAAFLLPVEVDFDQSGESFGAFVRNNPITTDYALYGEFLGRKGPTGPTFDEVRAIIVDKAGNCVWVDRQTPDDRDFKRLKPDCPMTCCVLLTERVRGLLDLPETSRKDRGEGKFARMFAENSPGPDKEEFAAMERRQAAMKKTARNAKVAVFPVRLSDDEVGEEDAAHLAKLLNKKKLCEAKALDSPLRVKIKPARNEQKVLWDLARAFQDHVKQNPPEADYALLADYMISPRDGRARAVHFVICDRDGEWVIVDFQNDHHSDFQSIDPKTREDCGRLVAKRLKGYLR